MDVQARAIPAARLAPHAFRLLIAIVPLTIALLWGATLPDDAYAAYHRAGDLAAGRGYLPDLPAALWSPVVSPLYALLLWLPARLGASLPQVGLFASALGWAAAALAVYGLGRAMHRPLAAYVSAALVAISPAFIPALGTEVPWVVALACSAAALGAVKRWRTQAGAIVLVLCLRLAPATLAAAVLLIGARWIEQKRFPVMPVLGAASVALAWGAVALWERGAFFSFPSVDPTAWLGVAQQLAGESDLYWPYLAAICAGLVALRTSPRALWFGLPWVAVAALRADALSSAMLLTAGSLLAGLGLDALARAILRPAPARRPLLAAGLALLLVSPLAAAQASSLLDRYRFRPVVRQALEGQAATWLREHSEPDAAVLSSPRVGFLSGRASWSWDAKASDAAGFAALAAALSERPPDYCVSYRGLAWERLLRTAWFQDDYAVVQRFSSPYDAASPVTVWRYLPPTKPQPVEAMLGDRIRLLSARTVDSVAAGETLDVRLDWTALQPVAGDYIVFVHLIDGGGTRVASHDGVPWGKKSFTYTWLPGDVVPDVHSFPVPPDAPPGTYTLWVGMYTWPDLVRLPLRDRAGIEQPNQALLLRSIEVVPGSG